jgi:hypothetical protein
MLKICKRAVCVLMACLLTMLCGLTGANAIETGLEELHITYSQYGAVGDGTTMWCPATIRIPR